MSGGGKACVIGWPIEHSRSPMIHNYWLAHYGIEGRYTKEAVRPEDFESFLGHLREEGFAGANVTVPHKERLFALADQRDSDAEAMGAANTLWFENGRLMVANTDALGFVTHLDRSAPGWSDGLNSAVILGAGGAARAVLHALLARQVPEIRLLNRTRERAQILADAFDRHIEVGDWSDRENALGDAGLLINTTSLGMAGSPKLKIELGNLAANAVVMDIVYVPLETDLLRRARAQGLRVVDGLGMLLHQAAPGFEKWFGIRPEVTAELRELVVRDIESETC